MNYLYSIIKFKFVLLQIINNHLYLLLWRIIVYVYNMEVSIILFLHILKILSIVVFGDELTAWRKYTNWFLLFILANIVPIVVVSILCLFYGWLFWGEKHFPSQLELKTFIGRMHTYYFLKHIIIFLAFAKFIHLHFRQLLFIQCFIEGKSYLLIRDQIIKLLTQFLKI